MRSLITLYIFTLGAICYGTLIKKPLKLTDEKTILCDDTHAQKVRVESKKITVLSFPVVPKDVVPGENSFDFKRISNDVVIKSLRPGAATNIVVYMPERRCAFDLVTVTSHGDGILNVKDPPDKQFEVKFQ
jgi:hypothetical protein